MLERNARMGGWDEGEFHAHFAVSNLTGDFGDARWNGSILRPRKALEA
jgi:hypothetical protein